MRKAAWRVYLRDPAVRRWYDNVRRGSEHTANEQMRVLTRYVAHHRTTPAMLVLYAKKDRAAVEDQLLDFIGTLEEEGKSPGYATNYVKAVRSFLAFNDIRLVRRFVVRDAGATPTLDDERVPNKDELRSILSSAQLRGRVIISLMAFAGLRPEVLGNVNGQDGLRLADLPDLAIVGKTVAFKALPAVVVVRPSLSKAGHRYLTFLASEGCDYLRAYLEARLAAGDVLGPESPVIRPSPGFEDSGWRSKVADRAFIVTKNVTAEVRRAMRPRYPWRPYVLRAYFDTQLLIAESNGKVTPGYRAYWMGHKGDMDARYTTNKARLPQILIEDMRRSFAAAELFLTTATTQVTDLKEMFLRNVREQAQAYGIDPMKIHIEKSKSGADLAPEEEIRLLTLEIAKRITSPPARPSAGTRSKVVRGEEALVEHLDKGWELRSQLGPDRYLLQTRA